jgi:hypothetical protein
LYTCTALSIVLYCIVLYCIVLYCIVLYCVENLGNLIDLFSSFRLHRLLGVMRRNGLSVASPAIQHASMSSTTPYKYSARSKQFRMPPLYTIGATVKSIEIFATLFTLQAWSCFWDMVEPRWNAAGW